MFAQAGRPVKIIFDHDPKLKTKVQVYKATIATAKLLDKSGCKVRVGMLPSMANGKNAIDDFVVAGGDIGQIISGKRTRTRAGTQATHGIREITTEK